MIGKLSTCAIAAAQGRGLVRAGVVYRNRVRARGDELSELQQHTVIFNKGGVIYTTRPRGDELPELQQQEQEATTLAMTIKGVNLTARTTTMTRMMMPKLPR